jgi:two-component system, NtrC family, nitrogen regulation response regulator GlnG
MGRMPTPRTLSPDADDASAAARVIADAVPALADALLAASHGDVYRRALGVLERPLIARVLTLTGGNQVRAARLLGLNRNTLRKRCRELDLPLPRAESSATR